MTTHLLRNLIGLVLVGSHFILLAIVGMLTVSNKFTVDEMFILVGILGPLFAAYTTAIIRHILRDEGSRKDSEEVGRAKLFISISLPICFVVLVVAGVFWKAYGPLTFDNLIKLVAAAETAIGVYVGMIVANLFDNKV